MRTETKPVRITGRLPGLDGVRGLAILMVLAVHFVGDATPTTWGERLAVKLANYGMFGVDLFFVLSGFLITGLLLDSKGDPHYFRNFYARRTLRIFPLYYAVLALLFIVLPRLLAVPAPLAEARAHQGWLWTYTANFFIAAKGTWALSYVSHFWSLAIEEHFYLLWPFVVLAVRRDTLERICLVVIGAALALRIGLSLAGVSDLSISVLTPCRVDALCLGGLLAAVGRRDVGAARLVRQSGRAVLAVGAITLAVSAWCALTKSGLALLHPIRGTLLALFFGALTLTSVQDPGASFVARVFHARWLRTFGKYSYGLYVYHGVLSQHMLTLRTQDRLEALLGGHSIAIAAQAGLGVAISFVVAALSYELFEKKFLGLKKYFEPRAARATTRRSAAGAAVVAAPPPR